MEIHPSAVGNVWVSVHPMCQTSVCPRPGGDGEIDNENKGRRRNQETGRYESIKDALMDAYEAAVEVEKYYKEMRNGLVWHMAQNSVQGDPSVNALTASYQAAVSTLPTSGRTALV